MYQGIMYAHEASFKPAALMEVVFHTDFILQPNCFTFTHTANLHSLFKPCESRLSLFLLCIFAGYSPGWRCLKDTNFCTPALAVPRIPHTPETCTVQKNVQSNLCAEQRGECSLFCLAERYCWSLVLFEFREMRVHFRQKQKVRGLKPKNIWTFFRVNRYIFTSFNFT